MDQERDTTDSARSSRRGRFWLESGSIEPTSEASGDSTQPHPKRVRPRGSRPAESPGPVVNPSTRDVFDQPNQAQDDEFEVPPTLFELPDRTPKTESLGERTGQVEIHNAHAGPPASHVDRPPGNHSDAGENGPVFPLGPHFATLDEQPTTSKSWLTDVRTGAKTDALTDSRDNQPGPADDTGIAAQSHDTDRHAADRRGTKASVDATESNWAKDTRATWITRSAIVMSVLVMVTVAFVSGRGLHQMSASSDAIDPELEALAETVVIITEEPELFDGSGDPQSMDANHDSYIAASQTPFTDTVDETPQLPPQDNEGDSAADLPSYIADAPIASDLPKSALGEPSVPTESASTSATENTIAGNSTAPEQTDSATDFSEEPTIPDDIATNEAVVAFRADEAQTNEASGSGDDLPSGMASRLNLEDGVRYSNTPHPIGNFLEILKRWEAAAAEAARFQQAGVLQNTGLQNTAVQNTAAQNTFPQDGVPPTGIPGTGIPGIDPAVTPRSAFATQPE